MNNKQLLWVNLFLIYVNYTVSGGDLGSTWVAKLAVHVEDVANLVKNVTKSIVANKKRNFANDGFFAEEEIAQAA